MGASAAFVLFLLICLGWIMLAFLPGLSEVRRRDGSGALPVTRDSRVDIRHFARAFGDHVEQHFGRLIVQCRERGEPLNGALAAGGSYLIVPGEDPAPPLGPEEAGFCERMIISAGGLRLPDGFVHAAEVHAEGDVRGGARSVYRAVLAGGSLELAPGSASLRWLHADVDLNAAAGCLLHGRASADRALRLEAGCRFERLHAPTVDFGDPADTPTARSAAASDPESMRPVEETDVPRLRDTRGGRWLVDRDFELAAGRVLAVDTVVRGRIVVREGALVRGSLKSRGDMFLERGVRVEGSLVSEGDLVVGEDCRVAGPVVSEATLTLGRGCVVGEAARATTASAARIRVEPGARCHGTVWAHERGDVLSAVAAQQGGGR